MGTVVEAGIVNVVITWEGFPSLHPGAAGVGECPVAPAAVAQIWNPYDFPVKLLAGACSLLLPVEFMTA
jgi:hypothetical protein